MLITGAIPLGKQPSMFSGFTVSGTLVRAAGLFLILPVVFEFSLTFRLVFYFSVLPLLIAAVIVQESCRR